MKKLIKNYNIPVIIRAIGLMKRRKGLFVGLVLGFCSIEIVGSILYSNGLRGVINSLGGGDWFTLARHVITLALSSVLWWIYAPIASYGCAYASKGTIQRLKVDLCERIMYMPMTEIDKRDKGELLSALTSDLEGLARIYDLFFFQLCHTSLCGIAGLILMASIDWRFAIVVFGLGCVSVLLSARFNAKLERRGAVAGSSRKDKQRRLHACQGCKNLAAVTAARQNYGTYYQRNAAGGGRKARERQNHRESERGSCRGKRLHIRLAPFLGFGLLIPVNSTYFSRLGRAAFQRYSLAVSVKNIFLFRLRRPCAVLIKRAQGQHDMRVGIAVAFIVDTNIGAHPLICKLPLRVLTGEENVLFPSQFRRQGYFNLAGKLGGAVSLGHFNSVPQYGAVCIFSRRVFRQQDFGMNNAALPCVVMRHAVVFAADDFSSAVSRCRDSGTAFATADDFYA